MHFFIRLGAIVFLTAGTAITTFAQNDQLTVSPSPVVFCGQPGQVISSVPLSISTSNGSTTFIVTSVTSDGNWLETETSFAIVTTVPLHWLVLRIKGGVIPFPAGVYNGQIVLGGLDGAKLATIPVVLQVSAKGCGAKSGMLFADTGPVMFQLVPGATSGQYVNITNTFATNVVLAPWATTSTDQKWFSTTGNNLYVVTGLSYPSPIGLGLNAAGLIVDSTYSGNLELDSSNNASLNIPVTLSVSASRSAQFAVTPSPLSIRLPAGVVSANVDIQLTNLTASQTVIAVSASPANGSNWLVVRPPAATIPPNGGITLSATITAAGLANGVNKGSINVQVLSGSGGSMTIQVTVPYGLDSEINATPNPLSITATPGGAAVVNQSLMVSSNAGVVSYSAKAFSSVNQPWLSVSPFSSTVAPGMPAKLTLSIQSALLPAGPAIGVITLAPVDGSSAVTVPVHVNAGQDSSLSVFPAQFTFTSQAGATGVQIRSLSLTSTGTSSYILQTNTATGGDWLTVNPSFMNSDPAGNVTVFVNPAGLPPNTYAGQVVITNTSTGAQQIVPVTLTVGAPASLSVSPAALTFHYEAGSVPLPLAQSAQVTGGNTPFTTVTSGLNGAPNFLTVNLPNGSAPSTIAIGLNFPVLAGLDPGEYTGAVTISSSNGNQIVFVTLIVMPKLVLIVSAASLQAGPIAPGELVTIYGTGLGPPEGARVSLDSPGRIANMLAGVTVTFDGIPSPLIYVGPGQINTIVPYEVAGRESASIIVSRNGVASAPIALRIVDTAPAIFSSNQTGNGQGAILNADGSYNQPANAAAKESVIQIFATGAGLFADAITGSVTPSLPPFHALLSPVEVTIGGEPAEVRYAGEAPGLVSGILQVNAVVPLQVAPGPQPVVLTVGGNGNSSQRITVSVQ